MNKIVLVFILCSIGCSRQVKETNKVEKSVSYATTFHFEDRDDTPHIIVDKPWPNAKTPISYSLDKSIKRIVCTSTSHLPFLEMLGHEDKLVGFPNLKYISSETFKKRAEDGQITDLGTDGKINLEVLLGLQPDAVIAFDMGGESTTLDKIEEAGIRVYYNADFLETSPLGRAEWIKFFGAILNEEAKADSIFSEIETRYQELVELGKNTDKKPTVLNGVVYGDTWFMPGGGNWASIFYENAGSQYLWADDTTSGWLELSFEAVFDKGRQADFWIGTSTFNSKSELLAAEGRYGEFEPFSKDRVYNYSKKRSPTGGYDFFESGYARPDLVLADLISIVHPELLTDYETVYFEQLK